MRILLSLVTLLLLANIAAARPWRGIVPLKSTRTDVERLLGKPNAQGYYVFKDERVSFEYGDEPCRGLYRSLGEDNCKCLANEGAVMSILVEPTVKLTISSLQLDMKKFKRTPITPFPQTFVYADENEGIVYTVDEQENEVLHVTYYPSTRDCEDIIAARAPKLRNSWRGLVPAKSSRTDVEALLGRSTRDSGSLVSYETEHESVVAKYANGNCSTDTDDDWNVPKDTLIELIVNPNPSLVLQELHLNLSRYERQEIFPFPEIPNPPKVWTYFDRENGIRVRSEATKVGGDEVVVSITYLPSREYQTLRCR